MEALKEIGQWMKVNGEAIYGTEPDLEQRAIKTDNVRYTAKPGKLYIHLLRWPEDGQHVTAGLKGIVKKVALLSSPEEPLKFTSEGGDLTVQLPKQAPGQYANVLRVEME